ncbi:hypothetical protein [Actinocorallia longicatena]|uniref:Uncharacterized protein n=1 Tax=Actinocorallia longicatena TaxID=111803 RepID=A0ABP6Q8C7_9ACTN
MGYTFRCADGSGGNLSIPGGAMVDLREVLRLAVTFAGDESVVQMSKFESNGGRIVTPEECREIARLLGGREGEYILAEYRNYVDGIPDGLTGDVRELAELCARAADHGGMRVG